MKYIDVEKLKKIVEQAKQRALKGAEVDEDMYCDGRADAFGQVLLEIDSLQQEQDEDYPIVAFDGKDRMPFTWGLEKTAQEYEFSCYQRACFHPEHKWPSTTKDAFIAGAQWQRGQGQTKEGEVIEDGEFIKFSDGTYIVLCPGLGENSFDFKTGDKVIVQIHNK